MPQFEKNLVVFAAAPPSQAEKYPAALTVLGREPMVAEWSER